MSKINKIDFKLKLFFYNYEYQILILSSIFSGALIIHIANNFFLQTSLYYFVFFFGIFISLLGFILEFAIKYFKKKAIEKSFTYFLQDLAREYKITKNISIALTNITETNIYGTIDSDIKKISNRVSWGESFELALKNVNSSIKSPVIDLTLRLLITFKDSNIAFDRLLLNISKDISVFKEESQKKKYFLNLFYLSIVIFFIFISIILVINVFFGYNFLWYSVDNLITRIFFDNFLLYIAVLLSIFISFIMVLTKDSSKFNFIKYTIVFFMTILLFFQITHPKPDAIQVLVDSIAYMNTHELDYLKMNSLIGIQSISSQDILSKTNVNKVSFLSKENQDCSKDCFDSVIFISDVSFLDFEIYKTENDFLIIYDYE